MTHAVAYRVRAGGSRRQALRYPWPLCWGVLQHPAKLGPLHLSFPTNKRCLLSGPPHFDDIADLQTGQQVGRRTQIDTALPTGGLDFSARFG